MDEMQNKLDSILGNPKMMEQIMSMAQSLGASPTAPPEPQEAPPALPIDGAMLTQIAGFAKNAAVDKNQQRLLAALSPYLTDHRLQKLEKAMRAAKIAGIAATALSGGIRL